MCACLSSKVPLSQLCQPTETAQLWVSALRASVPLSDREISKVADNAYSPRRTAK